MVTEDRRLVLLATNRITCLLSKEKMQLAGALESSREFVALNRERLGGIVGRHVPRAVIDPAGWLEMAREDETDLTDGSVGCIFYEDPAFPEPLRPIHDPPLALYYRGRMPDWQAPRVAVVGTRDATAPGMRAAWELGGQLARGGVVVVSGLARGIDAAAHDGSMLGVVPGVAVLGNGIDRLYPPSSASLGRRLLARHGCVLSEYPPGTPPCRHQFPARNRIIAGLAQAVVVVQAPRRSGALITVDFALEGGKDVFVHEIGLEGSAGAGTRDLAECGAGVVRDAEKVLAAVGAWTGGPPPGGVECEDDDVGLRVAKELERELEQMA